MKVLLLTGSHPRHAYLARCLEDSGHLAGLVIEAREAHVPASPDGLPAATETLFRLHFQRRAQAEQRFFSDERFPDVETLRVSPSTLNGPDVQAMIRRINPDLLLSYGVHMLSPETLDCCTGEKWNIHGGLSPWYRGAITHFWPSYMLEPQFTGMTVHDLTPRLDGGPLVHQSAAALVRGDGLHDLACRAVTAVAGELPELMMLLTAKGGLEKQPQKSSGKLWLASDWRPEHLHLIYDVYGDRIVDYYLDGELTRRPPQLYRQFPSNY